MAVPEATLQTSIAPCLGVGEEGFVGSLGDSQWW